MTAHKPISQKALLVCQEMSRGASVQKGCATAGMGTDSFYDEMRGNEELAKEYTRARECRADVRFEKFQDILDECKAGLVDPAIARVLVDAIKWQTGKEKPKVYGDSTTIRGDKENPLELSLANVLQSAELRRPALSSPDIIEGEVIDVTPEKVQ